MPSFLRFDSAFSFHSVAFWSLAFLSCFLATLAAAFPSLFHSPLHPAALRPLAGGLRLQRRRSSPSGDDTAPASSASNAVSSNAQSDFMSYHSFGITVLAREECETSSCGSSSSSSSRWQELYPEVLAKIFDFLSLDSALKASRVCRAWQTSACVKLFFTDGSLNMRPLDTLQGPSKLQYAKLLDKVLSLPSSYPCWNAFIAPRKVAMPDYALLDFARRTPRLCRVTLPLQTPCSLDILAQVLPHWARLEGFRALIHRKAASKALWLLSIRCRKLRELGLYTRIAVQEALIMVESFPRLSSLHISRCVVTVDALRLILDGCKRLEELDVRHSKFVDEVDVTKNVTPDVLEKASTLSRFTYCNDPGACPECFTESFLF